MAMNDEQIKELIDLINEKISNAHNMWMSARHSSSSYASDDESGNYRGVSTLGSAVISVLEKHLDKDETADHE